MKSQVNTLELVYPPVSNREAQWLADERDPAVQDQMAESNLYMIAKRPEVIFTDIEVDPRSWTVTLDLLIPNLASAKARIDFRELCADREISDSTFLEAGEKMVRLVDENPDSTNELIEWFNTEKLLYERWRGRRGLYGLENYRDFTKYKLLYVGISKKKDSFKRLVENAHKKRVKALSLEESERHGSNISDELYLFFFEVKPLRVEVRDFEYIDEINSESKIDYERSIADAEKAYVSLCDPKYNKVTFQKYPAGKDGLQDSDLKKYGYTISEDITLTTTKTDLIGDYDPLSPVSDRGDFIFVTEDNATLIPGDTDIDPRQV